MLVTTKDSYPWPPFLLYPVTIPVEDWLSHSRGSTTRISVCPPKKNSVIWVRERTTETERPPLIGEVSSNFCGYRVPRGQRDGSLRPYSRISRPEPLLFLPSSSSIVLTRLSGPRSRPTTSQKIWKPEKSGPDLGLATGEPDVRTFDLGASFSLSLSFILHVYYRLYNLNYSPTTLRDIKLKRNYTWGSSNKKRLNTTGLDPVMVYIVKFTVLKHGSVSYQKNWNYKFNLK
jgi:hypothetical protein